LAWKLTVAPVAMTMTVKVTIKVKDHVPVSPCVSESVPEAIYVPASSSPVDAINPVELTIKAGLELVVTNVTGPEFPLTLIGPAVNDADDAVVVVPDFGEVWVRVVGVGVGDGGGGGDVDGATVRT
jgi:hypothetical protein